MAVPFLGLGFTVEDFIRLGPFAWSVYERCRKSSNVKRYSGLAGELLELRKVLRNLQVLIEQQALEPKIEAELFVRGRACRELLVELETLLERYESQGTQSDKVWDRTGWNQECRNIRARLLTSLTLLSASYNDAKR